MGHGPEVDQKRHTKIIPDALGDAATEIGSGLFDKLFAVAEMCDLSVRP